MAWIVVGAVVALLILFFAFRANHYKRLFAPAHYVELARGLSRVKAGALETMRQGNDEPPLNPEDPRVLLTDAGLAVAYTITPEPDHFVHHYSISVPGNVTPSAVGTTFTIYVAQILDYKVEGLRTEVSERGVYHTEFALNAEEQADFIRREIQVPSLEQAVILHEKCQQLRSSLSLGTVQAGV